MPAIPAVVTGTVLAVQILVGPSWLPRTEVTLLCDDGEQVTFLLPGANGGPPAAVVGVPVVAPGQRWELDLDTALVGVVPRGHGVGMRALDPQPVWNLNGNHLPDALLPWPFLMNEEGICDLGPDATEAIFEESLAQWARPACTTFAFDYQGRTTALAEDDGLNVMAWENETWEWHEQAAAMSVVRFDYSGDVPVIRETDILFNAVDFGWSADEGNASHNPPVLHAGSVLTHELGHSTGMDHEYFYVTSTMYYAYFGGTWMATLSGDDLRGVCENYPSGEEGCASSADCEGLDTSERYCREIDGLNVCDEVRDELGAPCAIDAFNCEEVCLFGNAFYTDGACTLTCPEGACPEGYTCLEQPYTIPLEPGPVCAPDTPDTGDTAGDSATPEDSAEGEPEGCSGCASGRGAGWTLALTMGALGLTFRRRQHRVA